MDATVFQSLPTLILINGSVFTFLFLSYFLYKKFFAQKKYTSLEKNGVDFWTSFSQEFFVADKSFAGEEALSRLLEMSAKKMALSCVMLSRFDQNKNFFEVQECLGAKNPWSKGDKFLKQNSYCHNIYQTKKPVLIDYTAVSEWRNHEVYKNHRVECFIGVPLCVSGEFYGVLSFFDFSTRQSNFSADDLSFVNSVAKWTGLVIENNSEAYGAATTNKAA